MNPILLYFVKDPVPGRVKTRLAAEIGAEAAAEIYRRVGAAVWSRLEGGEFDRWVLFDPPDAEARIRSWLPGAERYLPQASGDLGLRMREAFRTSLSAGVPAAALGSDVPEVSVDNVLNAFVQLRSHDLVLGPCHDGGYWLIAMNRLHGLLFEGIRWGTAEVLRRTRTKAAALGLRCALLEARRDLDREEDLRHFPDLL